MSARFAFVECVARIQANAVRNAITNSYTYSHTNFNSATYSHTAPNTANEGSTYPASSPLVRWNALAETRCLRCVAFCPFGDFTCHRLQEKPIHLAYDSNSQL